MKTIKAEEGGFLFSAKTREYVRSVSCQLWSRRRRQASARSVPPPDEFETWFNSVTLPVKSLNNLFLVHVCVNRAAALECNLNNICVLCILYRTLALGPSFWAFNHWAYGVVDTCSLMLGKQRRVTMSGKICLQTQCVPSENRWPWIERGQNVCKVHYVKDPAATVSNYSKSDIWTRRLQWKQWNFLHQEKECAQRWYSRVLEPAFLSGSFRTGDKQPPPVCRGRQSPLHPDHIPPSAGSSRHPKATDNVANGQFCTGLSNSFLEMRRNERIHIIWYIGTALISDLE